MKRIFILMLLVNSIFYSKEITKFMKENERTIIQIYDVREELQLSSEKILGTCKWTIDNLVISFNENDVREYYNNELKTKKKICSKKGEKEKKINLDKFIVNKTDKISIFDNIKKEYLETVLYGRSKSYFLRDGRSSVYNSDFLITSDAKEIISITGLVSTIHINNAHEYIESKINNEEATVAEREKWVRIKNNVVKAEKNQGNEIVEITE